MKYALLSDIHASLEALRAVLDDACAEGARRFLCTGDLVGYHAEPDACIELLRAHDPVCVAGNHDRVAAGLADPANFGEQARRAILWTRARLSDAGRAYLAALPLTSVVDDRLLLFHGALHPVPNVDLHLSSTERVRRSIQALRDGPWGVRLAFFGHTHRGVVHQARGALMSSAEADTMELTTGAHYLVNPGSVGQPRDGDPRASYLLFDSDASLLRFRRVPFDVDATLAKTARAGLPLPNAEPVGRLARFLSLLARRSS